MGTTAPIVEPGVASLRRQVHGAVLEPGEAGYDEARTLWNAMVDRRPAVIARCRDGANVVAALAFARERDLPLSVRGGGHNVAGNALVDGGLTIDLSDMRGIAVDAASRRAVVQPGVLWGKLDNAAQIHGLATVGGTVNHTGVAGLTLEGGFGWLSGKHGLTIDNLLAAEVVTADGRVVRVGESEHPDLFWALRGAGANFGVVTSFTFRLHPVGPAVLGGGVVYPLAQGREVLRHYRDFVATAPDELTTYAALATGPDGQPVVSLALCYSGDLAEGERVVAPLRRFGQPLADMIAPMPYVQQQELLSRTSPPGRQNYWQSGMARELTDTAIGVLVESAARVPSPHTAILIAASAGAVGRVAPDATAYWHRQEPYNVMLLSAWDDPAGNARNIAWTRETIAALQPELTGGIYVNDLNDPREEGEARIRRAYGGNHDRLVELKTRWDPDNVFRSNQNIRPRA